jgi:hypothetical protein
LDKNIQRTSHFLLLSHWGGGIYFLNETSACGWHPFHHKGTVTYSQSIA